MGLESFEAAFRQGQSAHAARDYAAAEKFYRAALDEKSDDTAVLFNLGAVLQQQRRPEEAAKLYRLLLVFDPSHQGARVNLSKILFDSAVRAGESGDGERAAQLYESALKTDAACFAARINLTQLVQRSPDRWRQRYRPALVATVPRSGTYFTVHVLEFLERRLGGHSADYDPAPEDGVFDRVLAFPNLGLFKLTLHGICPGFEESYRGKLRAAWDEAAASAVERVPAELAQWFDPRTHADVRLVHIYRSPFEQVLSHFRMQVRQGTRVDSRADLSAQIRPIMHQFIAQYLSFTHMKEQFPAQILLLDFKHLTTEPQRAFAAMLEFFGCRLPGAKLLDEAIQASSPTALARIEDRLGRASGPGGALSHFDRKEKTSEQASLSPEDEALIRDMLEACEIDPQLFRP